MESTTLWRSFSQSTVPSGPTVLGQVDRAQAAVLVGSKPLLAARIGGFQLVQVRHRVGAVGGIQEEHARLAVVVRLGDDLVEQVARADGLIDAHGDAGGFGLFERAAEACGSRAMHVGEAQVPIRVVLRRRCMNASVMPTEMLKLVICVFVGLAGDELFDIRMVHAQHGHVGAAAGAALGDLAEGLVVDAQEAHRPGGLPGGGFHQRALGAQAREGEAVAAAGLLDQRRIAQGLEDAGRIAAHVIGDGQHKAGGQLAQRRAGAGKGGGVGEEALAGQQLVIIFGAFDDIARPSCLRLWRRDKPPARTSLPPFQPGLPSSPRRT